MSVTEIAAALQDTRTVQEVRFGAANALAATSVLELHGALSRRALGRAPLLFRQEVLQHTAA